MKLLSLFSGIGAFEKALKNIGISIELVGFSEIDKFAIKSYCAIHNVDESLNLGDITKIDITKLPKDIDMITHGSPCQDFSIAGKQAGGDLGTGTRSSLMWNTINIVTYCKPKYVIWENVKNLLSKKHKHNFDNYLSIMESLGYNNYYQVLNAKDYGIPQNRERVYTISIRKDIDKVNFKFPQKQGLKIRLKDMLEDEVDEKYYLSNEQVNKIKASNYCVNSRRIQEKDYCDTLAARDYKDPKCVQVGNLSGGKWDKINESCRRVYSDEGISPTIHTCQGGNTEPKIAIINPLKSKTTYGWHFEQNVYDIDGICRTVKAGGGSGNIPKIITHNIKQTVKVRKYKVNIPLLRTILISAKNTYKITNKEIAEKLNIPITQIEHYFRCDNSFSIPNPEIWNKLKNILHINMTEDEELIELEKAIITFEEKEGTYEKSDRVYDEEGIAPTLMQKEEKILIKNATKKRYIEAEEGDSINLSYPTSKTKRGRVGKKVCQTITCDGSMGCLTKELRIRKLTPKECWRLMGFDDEDFEKAANIPTSNTQLYKQAGNSIVVKVLEKIFWNLLY